MRKLTYLLLLFSFSGFAQCIATGTPQQKTIGLCNPDLGTTSMPALVWDQFGSKRYVKYVSWTDIFAAYSTVPTFDAVLGAGNTTTRTAIFSDSGNTNNINGSTVYISDGINTGALSKYQVSIANSAGSQGSITPGGGFFGYMGTKGIGIITQDEMIYWQNATGVKKLFFGDDGDTYFKFPTKDFDLGYKYTLSTIEDLADYVLLEDFGSYAVSAVIQNDLTPTTVKAASVTTLNTALATKEDVSNKSTSTSLGTSNTLYPSQNAVKVYADAKVVQTVTNGVTATAPSQDAVFDFVTSAVATATPTLPTNQVAVGQSGNTFGSTSNLTFTGNNNLKVIATGSSSGGTAMIDGLYGPGVAGLYNPTNNAFLVDYDMANGVFRAFGGAVSTDSSNNVSVSADLNVGGNITAANFPQDLSPYELLANKENSVLDNSTTKYPTNNLVKTNLDAKQPQLNGTGFVKASGTTISYDNSTYLTTGAAGTTYFPLTGGAITGTGGAGYIGLIPQSTAPSTPASGVNLYARSTGALSWKGTNGFERSFVGTGLTADRTYTLPDANVTLVGTDNTQTITNKNFNSGTNTFPTFNQNTTGSAATWTTGRTISATGDIAYTSGTLDGSANVTGAATIQTGAVTSGKILDGTIANADINASAAIDATKINTGVVSNTEYNYLDGVTGAIQGQIDGKLNTASPAYTGQMTGVGTTQTGSSAAGWFSSQQTWNTTGNVTGFLSNITNTASGASSLIFDWQLGGVSFCKLTKGGAFTVSNGVNAGTGSVVGSMFGTSGFVFNFGNNTMYNATGTATVATSGAKSAYNADFSWSPTSGSSSLTIFNASPAVNQTGGANGTVTGFKFNPTVTAAADVRAIDVTTGGILLGAPRAVSTTSTLLNTDYIVTATGTITLTLPTSVAGKVLKIKDIGTGTVTLSPASGNIDGMASKTLNVQYTGYELTADGTGWLITGTF